MYKRMAVTASILSIFASIALFARQNPAPASSSAPQEFPVVLQQSVVAGKTPVGSKIRAKLTVATLVGSTVVPRNAVLSGEVIESVANSATTPSRLAIRMDSAQWKNESVSIRVFLTSWYYPTVDQTGQNLQYGPEQPAKRTWSGKGEYPNPGTSIYRPFPEAETDKGTSVPDTPASVTSKHRVQMKNVETEHAQDGAVIIVCRHSSIKLDKLTTYVLANSDLLPGK